MKPRYFTIPNLLTLSNLFCGSLAVLSAFGGNLERSFWLIVLAAVFDFCDGFAARLLKQYSPLGGELDSLADIVSFGLAPSAVVYAIYCTAVCEPAGLPLADAAGTGVGAWRYVAFIIVLLSALRLARFNVDTEQTSEFIGMPTPACAIFFASTGYLFARGMFTGFDMRLILIVAVVMALFVRYTPGRSDSTLADRRRTMHHHCIHAGIDRTPYGPNGQKIGLLELSIGYFAKNAYLCGLT